MINPGLHIAFICHDTLIFLLLYDIAILKGLGGAVQCFTFCVSLIVLFSLLFYQLYSARLNWIIDGDFMVYNPTMKGNSEQDKKAPGGRYWKLFES